MKIPLLCSLLAFGIASSAIAGSFGGPPPFTNLSPLQSGIDGSYQAIARGSNLTGIIRFAYQNGVQSPLASANAFVFFVNGVVTTGACTAAINGKELAGILGGVELPAPVGIPGNQASGTFSGKLDLEDRMSYFSGNGQIIGAGEETLTIPGTDIPAMIPGVKFKFEGVRTSFTPQGEGESPGPTPTSTP